MASRQATCKTCRQRFTPPLDNPRRANCFTCRPPRKRPGGKPVPEGLAEAFDVQLEPGTLEVITVRELSARGRLETVAGQLAVRLARTLDDPGLSAASASSLTAQVMRTMVVALEGAPRPPDAIDEFTERARRKREEAETA